MVFALIFSKDSEQRDRTLMIWQQKLSGIQIDLSLVQNLKFEQLLDKRNWTGEYTLTTAEVHTAIFMNVLVLGALTVLIRLVFGEKKGAYRYSANNEDDMAARREVRQVLAWVPTLLNSCLMTVLGFTYYALKSDFFNHPTAIFTYALLEPGEVVWRSRENVSVLAMIWFAMFNVYDIIFGVVHCPERLDPMTAWLHHPAFVWICTMGASGQGLFYKGEPFASSFMLCAIEELPTFLLAAGAIFPRMRTDWGFGGTFFVLRIVVHFYHMALCWLYDPKGDTWHSATTPKMIFLFTACLHAVWFRAWVRKYMVPLLHSSSSSSSSSKEKAA
jgi:hypothetical protein